MLLTRRKNMKRILCLTLAVILLFAFCACDISKAGTQADGDKPDLVIKATSAAEIDFTDRSQKFSFTVEVDPESMVGEELHYSWFVYMLDNGNWSDFAFLRYDDPNNTHNDRPVFDETVTCALNANYFPARPMSLGEIAEPNTKFKVTCVAYNTFPGWESDERKSSASIDFYVNALESIGPLE